MVTLSIVCLVAIPVLCVLFLLFPRGFSVTVLVLYQVAGLILWMLMDFLRLPDKWMARVAGFFLLEHLPWCHTTEPVVVVIEIDTTECTDMEHYVMTGCRGDSTCFHDRGALPRAILAETRQPLPKQIDDFDPDFSQLNDN